MCWGCVQVEGSKAAQCRECLMYSLQPVPSCPVPGGDGAEFTPQPLRNCELHHVSPSFQSCKSDKPNSQAFLFFFFLIGLCCSALCVLLAAL